jgi:hypothetical protein
MKNLEFYVNEMKPQQWWTIQNQTDKAFYFIKASEINDHIMVAATDFVRFWFVSLPKAKLLADIYSSNNYLNVEEDSEKVMFDMVLESMQFESPECQYEISHLKKHVLNIKVVKKIEFFSLNWSFNLEKVPADDASKLIQAYIVPCFIKMTGLISLEGVKPTQIVTYNSEIGSIDITHFNTCSRSVTEGLLKKSNPITVDKKEIEKSLFTKRVKSSQIGPTGKSVSGFEDAKEKRIKPKKQTFL